METPPHLPPTARSRHEESRRLLSYPSLSFDPAIGRQLGATVIGSAGEAPTRQQRDETERENTSVEPKPRHPMRPMDRPQLDRERLRREYPTSSSCSKCAEKKEQEKGGKLPPPADESGKSQEQLMGESNAKELAKMTAYIREVEEKEKAEKERAQPPPAPYQAVITDAAAQKMIEAEGDDGFVEWVRGADDTWTRKTPVSSKKEESKAIELAAECWSSEVGERTGQSNPGLPLCTRSASEYPSAVTDVVLDSWHFKGREEMRVQLGEVLRPPLPEAARIHLLHGSESRVEPGRPATPPGEFAYAYEVDGVLACGGPRGRLGDSTYDSGSPAWNENMADDCAGLVEAAEAHAAGFGGWIRDRHALGSTEHHRRYVRPKRGSASSSVSWGTADRHEWSLADGTTELPLWALWDAVPAKLNTQEALRDRLLPSFTRLFPSLAGLGVFVDDAFIAKYEASSEVDRGVRRGWNGHEIQYGEYAADETFEAWVPPAHGSPPVEGRGWGTFGTKWGRPEGQHDPPPIRGYTEFQREVAFHRDGAPMTFVCPLTEADAGGGTVIRAMLPADKQAKVRSGRKPSSLTSDFGDSGLGRGQGVSASMKQGLSGLDPSLQFGSAVLVPPPGSCLLFAGGAWLHGFMPVTEGSQYLLVGTVKAGLLGEAWMPKEPGDRTSLVQVKDWGGTDAPVGSGAAGRQAFMERWVEAKRADKALEGEPEWRHP